MDFWSFEITLYSYDSDLTLTEKGILYAEDAEEAASKLRLYYTGDKIKHLSLQWETNKGVLITDPPQLSDPFEQFDEIEDGRTYTVNMEDIGQGKVCHQFLLMAFKLGKII